MSPIGSLVGLAAISISLGWTVPCGAFVAPGSARVVSPKSAPVRRGSAKLTLSRTAPPLQRPKGGDRGHSFVRAARPRSRGAPPRDFELGALRPIDGSRRRFDVAAGTLKVRRQEEPSRRRWERLRCANQMDEQLPETKLAMDHVDLRLRRAVSETGSGEGVSRDLSGLRRALFLAVWIALVAYTFGPWCPGSFGDPADFELITGLYDPAMAGPRTAIFFPVFNYLGIVPSVFASLLSGGGALRKGRQPVPPQPFVFGAVLLGFFAVGPYLALRNYLPEMDAEEEPTLLERVLTSKLIAVPLLGASAVCLYNLVVALLDPTAVSGLSEIFWTSKAVHVSVLDLCVLSAAVVDPLREDMRRRGWEPKATKVAPFAVPLVGPTLWLVVRPPVVRP